MIIFVPPPTPVLFCCFYLFARLLFFLFFLFAQVQAMPTILSNRRAGGSRFCGRAAGRVPLSGASSRLLDERMRPLITTNGHGINPVFCVKFDRTGQYVFTGADDGLVKVSNCSSE